LGVLRSRYGFVVDVGTKEGKRLILRASPDPAATDQHEVSTALAALGVGPSVLEFFETRTGTWSVIERVTPGTPIGDMPWHDVDPEAISTALCSLVGQPAPKAAMATVTDWLRARLIDDTLTDLAPGTTIATQQERQHALAELDHLTATGDLGLCHGDASPWNLLVDTAGQVKLIDPRGLRGEVAFDLAVVTLKTAPFARITATVPYLARLVGIDPSRVQAWVRVADIARV
jgi:streptomycin 6-kinase